MTDETAADPELRLALGYAPVPAQAGLETLFALDARLGGIVARTTEPTIGLMRLVWWRDALAALETGAPPAEPLLRRCAALGLPGEALGAMTAGWEALLDDPELGEVGVEIHARERGGRLFALAGRLLGQDDARLVPAGEGWARVDLARHSSRPDRVPALLAGALPALQRAGEGGWPRPLRPLGQLAMLARLDAEAGQLGAPGSRRRLLRILRFHLTGR